LPKSLYSGANRKLMDANILATVLGRLHERAPLVHNITNYVVMNLSANALLAVGASPVMAHAPEEVEEMAALSQALVLNLGTLSKAWINAMFLAGRVARQKSIPIVLDPVGAGATRFRTDTAHRLLAAVRPTVLRGNASEILAIAGEPARTRGVDSVDSSDTAGLMAQELALKLGLVVAMTGAVDVVTDGHRTVTIRNGHPMLGRVTGSGCVASALTAACCAVDSDALVAASAALVILGIAGERAAVKSSGPGSFSVALLDQLNSLDLQSISNSSKAVLTPINLDRGACPA
jgi:hydroxyethylthiazole kinase